MCNPQQLLAWGIRFDETQDVIEIDLANNHVETNNTEVPETEVLSQATTNMVVPETQTQSIENTEVSESHKQNLTLS